MPTLYYITLTIITLLIGGFLVGVVIWAWVSIKKKPKIDTATKVINFLSEWADGHSSGWLIEQKKLPNKLTKIRFYPDDLNLQERIKGDISNETIIAKNVKTIPMGNLSSNVNIVWVFPNNLDELSKKLPNLDINLSFFDKKENIKSELFKKIEKITSNLPSKINKKDAQEIKNKLVEINNALTSTSESFIQIPTKQLFDYNVLLDNFMFEMGNGVIESKKASEELIRLINFGAVSSADRKRFMELYENALQSKQEEK